MIADVALPPVAHEALQVAQRYLAAAATSADLTCPRCLLAGP